MEESFCTALIEPSCSRCKAGLITFPSSITPWDWLQVSKEATPDKGKWPRGLFGSLLSLLTADSWTHSFTWLILYIRLCSHAHTRVCVCGGSSTGSLELMCCFTSLRPSHSLSQSFCACLRFPAASMGPVGFGVLHIWPVAVVTLKHSWLLVRPPPLMGSEQREERGEVGAQWELVGLRICAWIDFLLEWTQKLPGDLILVVFTPAYQ